MDRSNGAIRPISSMHMNRPRNHRAPHPLALIACLALFLAGSNYCLLSAWAGNTKMGCLVTPATAAAAKAPGCSHCAPAGKHTRTGRAAAKASCCPAPVVAPTLPSIQDSGSVPAHSVAAFLAAAIPQAPLNSSAWQGHTVPPDGQPPTRLARAPLSARAPPLA